MNYNTLFPGKGALFALFPDLFLAKKPMFIGFLAVGTGSSLPTVLRANSNL
jgi:hypothetical protein